MLEAIGIGRFHLRLALLALVAALVAFAAARHLTFLVAAENWLADFRTAVFGAVTPPDDHILVLAITRTRWRPCRCARRSIGGLSRV